MGDSGFSAVQVVLEGRRGRLRRDPGAFVALAADLQDRAVIGAAQVADVGADKFVARARRAAR